MRQWIKNRQTFWSLLCGFALLQTFAMGDGLCAFASSDSEGTPSAQSKILELAVLQTYQDQALRLPITSSPSELNRKLSEHFAKFMGLVMKASDESIYRKGTTLVLRTSYQLGLTEEAATFSKRLMGQHFSACDGFATCSALIADLSSVVDLAPREVIRILDQAVLPKLANLTEQLTAGSSLKYNNSTSQRVLLYRANSLRLFATFYEGTQLRGHLGYTPTLNPFVLDELKQKFSLIDQSLKGILPDEKQSWESDATFEARLAHFRSELATMVFQDLKDFEKKAPNASGSLDAISNSFADALIATQSGNRAMALYLERVNHRDLSSFFSVLRNGIQNGTESASDAFLMAVYFCEAESYLPYRSEWIALLNDTQPKDSVESGEVANQAILLINTRSEQLTRYLDKQGFDSAKLVHEEQLLANTFPIFNSLYYQANRITASQNQLGVDAILVKQHADDETKFRLNNALDSSLISWITLACYGHAIDPGAKIGSSNDRMNIFFNTDKFKYSEYCGGTRTVRGYSDPSISVIDRVAKSRISSIWKPFKIELAIDVISLPIMVMSSGASGFVAKPIEEAVAKAATEYALRASLGRVSTYLATRLAPRLISSMAGALTYSIVNHLAMTAVTLGKVPLYDRKRSVLQNYGSELLFGNAIFFFSPYSAELSERLGSLAENAARAGTSKRLIHELSALSARTGVDIAVFTAVPYFERWLMKALGQSNDPVVRGWVDFADEVGHSATAALTFRLQHASAL